MMNSVTRKLSKAEQIQNLLYKTHRLCKKLSVKELSSLDIYDYTYSTSEAIDELGLDDELIHQLLEDYVSQILNTKSQFKKYINNLKELSQSNKELDYTPLRELAHKNLGVARNLRIKDGEILLNELMKKDDLTYLEYCLSALVACAIKLKPSCAYDTLKLIKIKKAL